MFTSRLFEVPASAALTVPKHSDGSHFSVQLFSMWDSPRAYVGLPVRSHWTPLSAHLFTRETAERIVWDLHTWEAAEGIRGEFAEDGTLTFTWDEEFDGEGGTRTVEPDRWGRYLIGGIWDWEMWDTGWDGYLSDRKGAFLRGACEYRQEDEAETLPEDLRAAYRHGRAESHRLTLHLEDIPEDAMRAALAPYGITADTDDDCGNSWLHIPLSQVDGDESGLYLTADVLVDGADEVFVDEMVGGRRAEWQVSVVSAGEWGETLLAVPYGETERVAAFIADYLTRP